jgi:hypothetical protein
MFSIRLAAAAGAIASFAAAVAVPASAQDTTSSYRYVYATAGYSDQSVGTADLGVAQGRVGARFNRWLGVEAEAGFGVNREGLAHGETLNISNQQAAYVVGYVPMTAALDLFGRVGGGRTVWSFSGPAPFANGPDTSFNLGGGGQWFFDRYSGLRFEYTLEAFSHAPNTDTWALSYMRRF